MYEMISCRLWPNSMYVVIGAFVNLNVPLFGIRCTVIRSQLHTRRLFKYNDNGIRRCADVDCDCICGTVSRRLLTNSQYVAVGACVNLNAPLLGMRYRMQHETITIAHSPAIQTHYNANMHGSALMFIEYTERYIVLVSGEQKVGWCWCMFRCKCVSTRCTMHYDIIASARSPTLQRLLQCHMTWRADVDVD